MGGRLFLFTFSKCFEFSGEEKPHLKHQMFSDFDDPAALQARAGFKLGGEGFPDGLHALWFATVSITPICLPHPQTWSLLPSIILLAVAFLRLELREKQNISYTRVSSKGGRLMAQQCECVKSRQYICTPKWLRWKERLGDSVG